jgi:hypothetical protein
MKLVIPPVEIDEQNPFKHDLLHRTEFATALFNLISRVEEPLVISLDGRWGDGKTTFVRMWQGLLSQNGIKTIYFDAFANDFVDDPFIAIASEIIRAAETEFTGNESRKARLGDFKKTAAEVGGQLLGIAARVAVKAATLGVVSSAEIEHLKELKDDVAKGVSDLAGKLIDERISAYTQEIESIRAFQTTLESLASDIGGGSGKPLVIIIDELDRCKPTYAVQLVEKVKHLFSVTNIVFLLVMHREQLEESIRCVYGVNIDANTYLQKFVNLHCTLPRTIRTDPLEDYTAFCRRLYERHELEAWGDKEDLIKFTATLADHLSASLRQVERAFTLIAIYYASISKDYFRIPALIALLALMKVIDPKLYGDVRANRATLDQVRAFVTFRGDPSDSAQNSRPYLIGLWLQYSLMSEAAYQRLPENDPIRRLESRLWNWEVQRETIIPICCSTLDVARVS